jgi:hypothetical protein
MREMTDEMEGNLYLVSVAQFSLQELNQSEPHFIVFNVIHVVVSAVATLLIEYARAHIVATLTFLHPLDESVSNVDVSLLLNYVLIACLTFESLLLSGFRKGVDNGLFSLEVMSWCYCCSLSPNILKGIEFITSICLEVC